MVVNDDEPAPIDDEDDPGHRYPRQWHVYLVADEQESIVRVPGRLLDRIHRQADGTLQHHVERALEMYADKLEADAEAFVPGSQAPQVTPWRAPTITDPASPEEKAQLIKKLRRIGTVP